jgi:DNA repair photolyase
LGFAFRLEKISSANNIAYVRLLGGLGEALRFFHMVDPAITRKRSIEGQAIKNNAPLRVASIEDLGVELPMYDITTGTGDFIANGVVSHNCFARVTHTYMDMNAGRDFESKIVVKVNAPDVLRRELAAKKWKGEHIAMGTATDPYQRGEGRYRLMPGIIHALTDYRNPFSILTKGTLILRDLELLKEAARVTDVGAALSIGTLDEDAWRKSEPGTPHPRKRIEAVAALNAAGIPTGVMMAPILPGITDRPDQLREVVEAAIDAGATHVSPIMLHLRPVVKEEFMPWLAENYPDLVPRYERLYRTAYGPAADRNDLGARVSGLVHEAGGLRPHPGMARPSHRRPSPPGKPTAKPEQLSLLEPEEGQRAAARIARGRGGSG